MAIVDRLDIRRAQVLVEAILVEMSADKAMDLGVNWLIAETDSNGNSLPAGGFVQPVDGTGIGQIIQGVLNPDAIAGLPSGLTMGLGQIVTGGTSWAAVIRAVGGIGNTNIIATPSIVTLDNEEAEIKIAQEVPFVTGQYTSQGVTGTGGSVNPFQTIQREEVGNILKITPQINEGSSVLLKISQEASSIAASSQQVSTNDLITNKRTITTNVMVEDGGIIVLGGLISDEVRESKSQVPFLGSIPIIGELFKTRSVDKVKTNLMVFIRPRILRDGTDAAIESNAKYNYIRKQQLGPQRRSRAADAERAPADAAAARATGAAGAAEPGPRRPSPPGATPAERMQGSSSGTSLQRPDHGHRTGTGARRRRRSASRDRAAARPAAAGTNP